MNSLQSYMTEFKAALDKGTIQKAYLGLMEFMMGLRTYLAKKYPDYAVSGSIYQGYMDMSYFAFTPQSLKERKLKIAIVFSFDTFRFEVWLGGNNKTVQKEYWDFFKNSKWEKYPLVELSPGVDAILENVLVNDPDFSDLDALAEEIESKTLSFIEDIEGFLAKAK
jgi:hypothetical protein